MPYTLSHREQLETDSDREEDILLLHDLYTKRYLVTQSSNKLSKTYSPEDLMQLSPSNFKQLTRTTHIAFGKLCDLLRGDSIFYNNLRHKQIALEIQVAVGLSQLGSNGYINHKVVAEDRGLPLALGSLSLMEIALFEINMPLLAPLFKASLPSFPFLNDFDKLFSTPLNLAFSLAAIFAHLAATELTLPPLPPLSNLYSPIVNYIG
ncbi:hypothetical protein PPACK8108_LOCUS20205 [Phakopsora pachyrhizi]|uniref:Uncharacterized protein n=1 Tax=Phakopsora pachyrhizi TaxID=170000 RepID=A0AAV0BJC4_PHAPC|nr:hypothetical protein PPACK8108_LOCUS20205 [Phakopsora pachyrhizi]